MLRDSANSPSHQSSDHPPQSPIPLNILPPPPIDYPLPIISAQDNYQPLQPSTRHIHSSLERCFRKFPASRRLMLFLILIVNSFLAIDVFSLLFEGDSDYYLVRLLLVLSSMLLTVAAIVPLHLGHDLTYCVIVSIAVLCVWVRVLGFLGGPASGEEGALIIGIACGDVIHVWLMGAYLVKKRRGWW